MHLPLVDSEQQHQPQKREGLKEMLKENKSKTQADRGSGIHSLL